MNRFLNLTTTGCCALAIMLLLGIQQRSLAKEPLAYRAELTTASTGFDGKMCWIHARAGAIPPRAHGNPSETPIVVMTLQKLQLDRSDVFYGLCDLRTDDLGKTWVGPTEHATLLRRKLRPAVPCCFSGPRAPAATHLPQPIVHAAHEPSDVRLGFPTLTNGIELQ